MKNTELSFEEKATMAKSEFGYTCHEFDHSVSLCRMVVRYDKEFDFFRLYLEPVNGGQNEVPGLYTDQMDIWLEGTGLDQDQLCDLVYDFDIWG